MDKVVVVELQLTQQIGRKEPHQYKDKMVVFLQIVLVIQTQEMALMLIQVLLLVVMVIVLAV